MEEEDPLSRAEAHVSSITASHLHALSQVDALGVRVVELSAARDAADASRDAATAALDAKRNASANAMRDVKLVAARMVQDREAQILSLKRELAAVAPVVVVPVSTTPSNPTVIGATGIGKK